MKNKILWGERVEGSNRYIGGHSPKIASSLDYAVEEISTNADGTKNVKFTTQFSDGNLAKIKASTLFPETWSDTKIFDSITKVGNMPSLARRATDGATFHRGIVDGVQMEVIKVGDDVISGYPTGGRPTGGGPLTLPNGFE